MRLRAIALASFFMLWLAAACTPLTVEQIQEYTYQRSLQVTTTEEMVAMVEATEGAAAQQTAEASRATESPTPEATPLSGEDLAETPTLSAAATVTVTAAAELIATPSPTVAVTETIDVTPTPSASPTPTAAAVITTTPEAVSPTPSGELALDSDEEEVVPGPTATPVAVGTVLVTTEQANIRGGPGLMFDVVGGAGQGDELGVTGRDEAGDWWQICCVDGRPGWVSDSIVRFEGESDSVPLVGPLMPDDLQASWEVRWECHAEGCPREECLGQIQTSTLQVRDLRWLEMERQATWEDECGEDEDWLSQVDRYTGRQDQGSAGGPLFNVWEGSNPGPANRGVDLLGRRLALWCTDTRIQEQEYGDGWTVVYEGEACYDTTSGILALLQYTKRWLFSGTYEGQTFDRQYFGDYEVYQQVLTSTNAPLSGEPLPAGPG